MSRYEALFARLGAEGAFVPFVTVGDPDLARSLEVIEVLIGAGADALEVGLPFSDPIADGPVVQASGQRALAAGVRIGQCWELLSEVRLRHPEIPVGLLTYANLVVGPGPERFMQRAAAAGIDGIVVADIPCIEAPRIAPAAAHAGIDWMCVLPPDADAHVVAQVAKWCRGYTYVQGRAGATGTDREMVRPSAELLARLREASAPPPVVGFGISTPEHVRTALDAGARGAISGSAVVRHVANDDLEGLQAFVARMKAATLPAWSSECPDPPQVADG